MFHCDSKFVKKFCLGFVLVVTVMASAVASSYAADPDTIYKIIITNNEPVAQSAIRDVLTLEEGDVFSEKELAESLELLEKWSRFEEIKVETKQTADGWVITFDLLPALIISSVNFTGHFPDLTSRIRRNVTLRAGQIYHREEIIDDVKRIKRYFERDGFFATSVRVSEKINDDKGTVRITFNIRKGPRLRWRNIEVEGNKALSTGYIRARINTWFPYEPGRLRKSLEKIKEAYIKRGYPRARVRVERLERDFKTGKVDIYLKVSEHNHLTVRFHGNSRVKYRSLIKVVTFSKEQAYDNYEVRQSVAALKKYYLSRGFLSVDIAAERSQPREGEVQVDFTIKEGPQTLVKKIEFEGLEHGEAKKIKKDLSLKSTGFFTTGYLSEPGLKSDEQRMPIILRNQGFPEGELLDTQLKFNEWRDRATVEFNIDEGLYTVVKDVQFPGAYQIPIEDLLKPLSLKPGVPFSELALQEDQLKLENYYKDNGFPYATVKADAVADPLNGDVTVTYNIVEGHLVKIGSILAIGIDHMRASTVRSAMGLDRGDPYSYAKIQKGISVLRKLGSLNSVKVDTLGLEQKEETVHLIVHVEERERYVVDLKASYSTDHKLTGAMTIQNLDVLGYGKRMTLAMILGFDIRRGAINYIDPHLLGSDVEMILGAFIQDEDRPSFQVTDYGGSISFLRDIGRKMAVLARYQIQRANFRGGTPSPDEETENRTLPHLRLSFNYDTRDYFADPRHGIFGLASFDYFHSFFGFGANFFKMRGQIMGFLSPIPRITWANSLRINGIVPATSGEAIPRNELLYIGGDTSIRGFPLDKAGPLDASGTPIGQKFSVIFNSELQFRLFGQFKVVGFTDAATASQTVSASVDSIRNSAGLGVRYITPVGPIRLDYGFVLDPRPGGFKRRLHFTFGTAF